MYGYFAAVLVASRSVAGKYARQGFMKVIIAQGTLSLVSDYMS